MAYRKPRPIFLDQEASIRFDGNQSTLYFEPLLTLTEQLLEEVSKYVTRHGYDPRKMWYSGINPTAPKPKNGEHAYDARRHSYYLGSFDSMKAPTVLTSDPELQKEHWVVNPLKYALDGGALVVYDPGIIVGDIRFNESDFSNSDGFGTYIVVATETEIASAEIGRIGIARSAE